VVCFSGHSAQRDGADAVLEKPAPADQLIETVRSVLSSVASRGGSV
jgi:DNA-binding NarL/FixJ family response regulator